MSEWKPIETAPKDGTVILAVFPAYCFDMSIRDDWKQNGSRPQYIYMVMWSTWDNSFKGITDGIIFNARTGHANPTHWMALPPLPICTD